MSPADEREDHGSDDELQRQAAALNDLLGAIGLTTSEQTGWWNLTAFAELGGRTPTQAWLAGDSERVKSLVESWYAASAKAAERAGGDPNFSPCSGAESSARINSRTNGQSNSANLHDAPTL